FVESHWVQRVPDNNDGEHQPPTYGVMGLRDDNYFGHSLKQAAKLIKTKPAKLKATNAAGALANIRGAAALLRKYGNEEIKRGKSLQKLEDWNTVIAR